MTHAVRALRIEARRFIRDRYVPAFLALAALPLIALLGSLPEGLSEAPDGVLLGLRAHVGTGLLSQVALLAAALGAIRTSTAFAQGIVGRDALALPGMLPFWSRACSSAVAGALVGTTAWTLASMGVRLVAGADVVDPALLGPAAALGVGAGIWGFAIGALVRAPLSVLLVVFASLTPPLFLASIAPVVADLLPLGSALLAAGSPIGAGGDGPGQAFGALVAGAWGSILILAALLAYRWRSRLP
ncbi:hypothetical protein J2Y69_001556 [Microbacterium resistens]|uniref:ABC-2 type transport system permease protein n=1 Tax=Microbacterium resistens TaxID=156977 RepID=A0ABU1SBG0_9MICO|nr:hypothetical protein [Microbacterium resistens]MDR6866957.1 hypothetical protein [Microbacterium resistens]